MGRWVMDIGKTYRLGRKTFDATETRGVLAGAYRGADIGARECRTGRRAGGPAHLSRVRGQVGSRSGFDR